MSTRRWLAALALAVLAAGCGSVQTYRWPVSAAAAPTQRPEGYFEGQMPAATSMAELELVEAIGYGTRANMGDVIEAMSDEAQRYGASAIVRVRVDCGHGTCHGYGVAVRYLSR